MMELFWLLLVVLAVSQCVDTFFHGKIFRVDYWLSEKSPLFFAAWRARNSPLEELLGCPFCLTHHVAFLMVFLWTLSGTSPIIDPARFVIIWLAVTRLTWLHLNLLPYWLQMSRPILSVESDTSDDDFESGDISDTPVESTSGNSAEGSADYQPVSTVHNGTETHRP